MHSRVAVLMVADMVGYSRVMDRDEAQAIDAVRELRDTYLEPSVQKHGGQILKRMGDGWIIAFDSSDEQVRCAMEVQSDFVDHSLIRLRIGAHIGDILEDEHDFYGAGVNLAQRLQTEAPPGGLMVSEDLYHELSPELRDSLRDAGSFQLKNIARPVNGFQWRPPVHAMDDVGTRHRVVDNVPTISVEPFEFAPDTPEPRAVVADLRDQLIMRLSRRTGIRVLDEGAKGLSDAVYVLQGRLRMSRDRGRLNLKFILPEQGRTVWSQTYEGDTSDPFRFSDELIERVDSDLRLQINAFDGDRIVHLPDEVLSISELRSRAASAFYTCTVEGYERASGLMDQALQLNPTDAMALAMRAEGMVMLAAARHTPLDEAQLQMLESDLNEAVEASPRSDYIFSTRALYRIYGPREPRGAIADAERSVSLSPAYASGHDSLGSAYLLAGEFDSASRTYQKLLSLSEADPFLPSRLFFLAISLYFLGEVHEATQAIDRAIQLGPRQRCFHLLEAICHRAVGNDAAAAKSDQTAARLSREPSILAVRPSLPDSLQNFANKFAPGRP
jgi:class 3 adenylate cyclase/lipoprotein NlpI